MPSSRYVVHNDTGSSVASNRFARHDQSAHATFTESAKAWCRFNRKIAKSKSY